MAPTKPSPSTWTLRFKNHRSTTLLHVDPLQSINTIKIELLRALHQTHPSGRLPTGISIPTDSNEVLFAKLLDMHDHTQGWISIEGPTTPVADDDDQITKKGKGPVKYGAGQDSPRGAGLKEGGVLAFKFRTDELVIGNGDDVDEGLGLDEEEERWDVVIPSYDDGAEASVEMVL